MSHLVSPQTTMNTSSDKSAIRFRDSRKYGLLREYVRSGAIFHPGVFCMAQGGNIEPAKAAQN
jgi:hypothetical protein